MIKNLSLHKVDYYREEIDHLQAQCKQSREIGELAGLAVGAKQLLDAETEVFRLKSAKSHDEGVAQLEDSYRDERDRATEAGLRWQVEDLSSALERVQIKLEETNIQCELLALHARDLSSNAPRGSDSQNTALDKCVLSNLNSDDVSDPPDCLDDHRVQEDLLEESMICLSSRTRERNLGEGSEEEKETEEQRIEDESNGREENEKTLDEEEWLIELKEKGRPREIEEKERQIEIEEKETQTDIEVREKQTEIEVRERIEEKEKERQVNIEEKERQIEIEVKERQLELETKERQKEIEDKIGKEIVAELTLRLAEYKKEEMRWSQERLSWQEERAERVSERRQWQGLQHSWEEDSALERWKLSVLAEEIKCKWDEVQTVIYIFFTVELLSFDLNGKYISFSELLPIFYLLASSGDSGTGSCPAEIERTTSTSREREGGSRGSRLQIIPREGFVTGNDQRGPR